VPVKCQYSVVQVSDDKADAKRRRWLEIARHAAQQCRRPDVPTVSVPLSLADALSQAEGQKLLLFEGSAPPLGQVLDSRTNADSPRAVSMLIGPEGGLHKDEVALATEQGFSVVSLGPRILRAETAVVATLAVVSHHLHLQGASLDPSK
jgi:16S rRNA (uracil1498-N3)-methyltransferase